ncbi:PREDICTED: multidrug resistance protein 1-like [Priapulus caudatus]|uniref:Multidrug resistance protein 1-like n=1 Tax=Priapulus caudatus TaxID=37621 RepID=A0ABM1FAE0_PRICU|nr:PREDICTED: multidrug resistance protein 1-like [Priapulus caudatus]
MAMDEGNDDLNKGIYVSSRGFDAGASQKGNGTAATNGEDTSKDGDDASKDHAQISLLTMFRYATQLDVLLIVIGSLWSAAHGAGWPVLAVVFGAMTDTFIDVGDFNITNDSIPDGALTAEDFQTQMNQYALYYVYIGLGMFVASYFQVI